MSYLSITCADFEQWAGVLASRRSQEELPRLIRLLVFATNQSAKVIDFPAGESIVYRGWDGVTVAQGASIEVPNGTTAWELGTTSEYKEKAWDDYQKRCKEAAGPDGTPLNQCTFIFVTPRRWLQKDGPAKHRQTKEKWVEARKKEGIWADVRVYDCDDLVAWLERAPAVADWFRGECGKPDGVYSLEHWWRQWCHSCYPVETTASVLKALGNPTPLTQHIDQWVTGISPRLFALRGGGVDRKVALARFAAIFLERADPDTRDRLLARTVVVETLVAWRRVMRNHPPLIMICLFGHNGEVHLAAKDHQHHVLLPLDNEHEWPSPSVFVLEPVTATN